ncbi:GlxA family transcriptional regulator [uncultured Pseudomonas sp.]|uniref:GlxA family transcriptional regulator n=1 Tax=uncultured Pseudomonas sp. TaxID=114707 RepID=UPI0025FB13F2|nr:GlxA family transcriptional regulator [uncultured Pseudomonas sp.]
MTRTVAFLLVPEVLMLDFAGPVEVFSIANRYLPAAEHYRVVTIAAGRRRTLRCSNGMTIRTDLTTQQPPGAYDLLLVPGGPGAYLEPHPEVAAWLRQVPAQCPRYGAVCTGTFLLGSAGLLDGRRVTTHWNYRERLARRFPRAQVTADEIYLRDGPLLTSAGVTAGIDLALALVAEDHGKVIAREVAKVLVVVTQRQGKQAQFSPLFDEPEATTAITRVQHHIVAHIDQAYSISRLAELATMGTRNFARVFKRDTGMTPLEFVLRARIDHARGLLETSELPLKTVAFRSGFASDRCMRVAFQSHLGLTPAQYRYQFS